MMEDEYQLFELRVTECVILEPTQCPVCDEKNLVKCDRDGWLAWRSGTSIMAAFPDMGPATREMLASGICPSCWDIVSSE